MKGRVLVVDSGAAFAVAAVAGLPSASGAAQAPPVTVTASGSGSDPKMFSPPNVAIQVGDTVRSTNGGGTTTSTSSTKG